MRTRWLAGLGAAATALGLAAFIAGLRPEAPVPPPEAEALPPPKPSGERRLYCEFYNFVGRSPKVGFYFAAPDPEATDYAQIFQREADGAQTIFDTRPIWTYQRSEETPTLRSPDGAIQINLYGDARTRAGGDWFEAGLRSVQYLNLDGQCRRTHV
ncbi:hypothetical protein [Methylobacterium organophilum]|uniref:Uncharacterized protein n=1 Tax=Methylobacterium organophilum TaxID=410 RepID=A0ABQ4T6H8_METOR|nr:hypothetical protein [Methylobacterium organophilum]UMY17900.1 hypothetical protein MMB17_00600 [Methylobacterium organophilum]GJE25855.1 hypothetical protein LKMONMHP_0698 [Methylobacterium organophilum]